MKLPRWGATGGPGKSKTTHRGSEGKEAARYWEEKHRDMKEDEAELIGRNQNTKESLDSMNEVSNETLTEGSTQGNRARKPSTRGNSSRGGQ